MAQYRLKKHTDTPADRPTARLPESSASVSAWPVYPSQIDYLRQTGIEVIGAVPWGTHFCQFYATGQDLVETLVPYFRAGLEANEFCMWVTSAPLQVDQALAALRAAVPDLGAYLSKGQIEILDYTQWYTRTGSFDADSVLQGWTEKLADARGKGFEGLRLTGNTFWLEQALWDDFTRYEAKVNEVIGEQRMLALCTYSLEKCGAREILDVVANHQFALIKTGGRWEIIESTRHRMMEQALRESEERYRNLFEGMTEGFGLHEIICDEAGKPYDYRFLEINPAFERLTGLKRELVVGRTLSQVLPGDDPRWVELYGKVAITGEPVHFENYSPELKMYYDVYAYCPAPAQFAVIFMDITEQKRVEEVARARTIQVEIQRRLLEQREQERLQISRDLHDGPVQDLTAATFALQEMSMTEPDAGLAVRLDEIRQSLQAQIAELRGFAQELRPPTLAKFGLARAIRSHASTFQEKYPGLKIEIENESEGDLVPQDMRLALFRIYQESMNNIAKHAGETQVRIRLYKDEKRIRLEIEDNGAGFDLPEDWLELARHGHLGLVGMRERTEAIGGTFEISSRPMLGTRIRVTVPLDEQTDSPETDPPSSTQNP